MTAYDRASRHSSAATTRPVAELQATIDEAASKAKKAARQFGFEVCGDTSQVGESSGGDEESTEEGGDTTTETPAETTPVAPVTPEPESPDPAPVTPPVDGGGATPEPAPAPPTDDGSDSGGVTP